MAEKISDADLMELGERMLRLQFAMDSAHMAAVFTEISVPNYLILSNLARRMKIHEPEAKLYLSEISRELEIPINRASRIVQNLQNMGYVYWEHDSKGTFIYLSETGREVMRKQREILQGFFGNVVRKIGLDEFENIIDQMNRLEQVMEVEAENLDAVQADDAEEEESEATM